MFRMSSSYTFVLGGGNWQKTVCQVDKPQDICVDACATDQFWCDSDGVPQACTVNCTSGSGIAPTCSYASDGVCEVCASNKKYVSAGLYDGTPTATYVTPSITYPLCVPCPVDHYCPPSTDAPVPCPPGTYRNETLGRYVEDCHVCPTGFYCPQPTPLPCEGDATSP